MRILIVDDDVSLRTTLYKLLEGNSSYEVTQCDSGEAALEVLQSKVFDLVITDHRMKAVSGLDLIKTAKPKFPSTSFILMTAYSSIEQAVEALKSGADDYVMKPFDLDEMEHRIERIFRLKEWAIERELKKESSGGLDRLVGCSKNISDAKEFVSKVASVHSPVLILGPTGTGKEVLAQSIHDTSPRSKRSFVPINCASLNEQLMESELFGHEKGAFTGAHALKPGKFELANGGTLFLDEIGELSIDLQAKLLRVLQEKEFTRVGGVRTMKTDVRVIAATHRDLKDLVGKGGFREDLFYRLNVLLFETKPLAERRDDIPLLIESFWRTLSHEFVRKSQLSEELIAALTEYSFPGNIRELKNVLERLMVLGPPEGEIQKDALPNEFHKKTPLMETPSTSDFSMGLEALVLNFEKEKIEAAMAASGNNQVKAAKLLKISRGALQYKLKKLEETEELLKKSA